MLGEGPVWDIARQCLWFVDIKAPALYRFDADWDAIAAGAEDCTPRLQRWDAPAEIGWVLPAAGEGLLCGLADGLYRFIDGQFAKLRCIDGEPAGNRLNDACTDAAGRVYCGSMDNAETVNSGRFYRLDAAGCTPLSVPPICITNGPAISPDQTTIYLTDTLGRFIMAAPLGDGDITGTPRLFARFIGEQGYPDGPVADADGRVWTGMFAGWGVRCFAADGTPLGKVDMPVANCTKLAFGGPDLSTAFVTTARKGLDDAALAAQPHAGDLFAFRVSSPGQPVQPVAPGIPL
jgi:sugar lactone lactonase YvrE